MRRCDDATIEELRDVTSMKAFVNWVREVKGEDEATQCACWKLPLSLSQAHVSHL